MTTTNEVIQRREPAQANGTTAGDEERAARIVLNQLVEPGCFRLWLLVRQIGAVEALTFVSTADGRRWLGRGGARPDLPLTEGLPAPPGHDCQELLAAAQTSLVKAARIGARYVMPGDPEWPEADLHSLVLLASRRALETNGAKLVVDVERDVAPPLGLWVRGPLSLAAVAGRCVSVVGARASTGYGLHVATELAYGLCDREWTVVSGGAYGIDTAAHKGALAADGQTVAVLACGVDMAYPPGNATLFDSLAEKGLLVSEWPLGSTPRRHRFLIRNRVIAALGTGTVVVEAAVRSGAKTTARRAAELGRAVMAVPGPLTSALSMGCHQLIRGESARLVSSAAEVVEEIGRFGTDLAGVPRAERTWRDCLDPNSSAVLEAIPAGGTVSATAVAAETGLAPPAVSAALTALTSAGLVAADGSEYRLTTLATSDGSRDRRTIPTLR